jgi:hypothetical protein
MCEDGDSETSFDRADLDAAQRIFADALSSGKRIYSTDLQQFVKTFDPSESEYLVLVPLVGG